MALITNEKVKELVEELDLISSTDLEDAYALAEKNSVSLTRVLVERDLLSDDTIGRVLADFVGYDFVDLDSVAIDDSLLTLIPPLMAKKQGVVVFKRSADGFHIAMVNPGNLQIRSALQKKLGDRLKVFFTTETNLDSALNKYQKQIEKEFADIIEENISEAQKSDKAEDLPVIRIVDTIFEYAFNNHTSDIHIEPFEKQTVVRFRIDGILHDIVTLPKRVHDLVVTRIKIMSRLRTDEHLAPQDGKIRTSVDDETLDMRVSIVPIVDGEKVVIRLLSARNRQYGLDDLGFSNHDLVTIKRAIAKPYGMILVTGPTGSGKTTTLYSVLKILNKRSVNIATIEDPVEYDLEGVNQIQVNNRTNLTFSSGLRSILRQDPDIIMVGEIRDQETAGIAVNSAMTGHLVLSTLHTNDAPTALPRLNEMGIEPFLIASTVNIVVAQRLMRKICTQCITSHQVPVEDIAKHFSRETLDQFLHGKKSGTVRMYVGKGCAVCGGSGYTGRIGVFEVLEVSDEIRELIMKKADSDQVKQRAIKGGMTTMIEDGLRKAFSGVTTLEEVLRVTRE